MTETERPPQIKPALRTLAMPAVGDLVTCCARVTKTGTTSITVDIQTRARRRRSTEEVRVTGGTSIYAASTMRAAPAHSPTRPRRADSFSILRANGLRQIGT